MRPAISSRLGREIAAEAARLMRRAMRLLERRQPCLVAPVLTLWPNHGSRAAGSSAAFGIEKQRPAHLSALRFMAGDMDIVLIILPPACKNTSPIDPFSDRAIRRANPPKVARPARR